MMARTYSDDELRTVWLHMDEASQEEAITTFQTIAHLNTKPVNFWDFLEDYLMN